MDSWSSRNSWSKQISCHNFFSILLCFSVHKTSYSHEELDDNDSADFEINDDVTEIRRHSPKSKFASDDNFENRRDFEVTKHLVTNSPAKRSSSSARRDIVSQNVDGSDDKTAMERMIEDFHRNLPPPTIDSRQQKPSGLSRVSDSMENPTLAPSTTTASSSKRTSKHGTLNSQISNWYVFNQLFQKSLSHVKN